MNALGTTLQPLVDLINSELSDIYSVMQSFHWETYIKEELNVLTINNTWCLTTLPGGRILVGCKWLFKIKRNSDGSIARYKARLIAKGFPKKRGFDFQDTFSHIVKAPTIRIILTLALTHKWLLRQVDVNNMFLHGELTEDVYMIQSPGFEQCDE